MLRGNPRERKGNHVNADLDFLQENPFKELNFGSSVVVMPTVSDWDADGNLDLLVSKQSRTSVFLNEHGSLQLHGVLEPLSSLGCHETIASLAAIDFDWDGDLDLVVLCWSGVFLFERFAGDKLSEAQWLVDYSQLTSLDLSSTKIMGGTVVDWDFDGDLDLLLGTGSGRLLYLRQEQGRFVFVENSTFSKIVAEGNSKPTVEDWNGDGRLDLVVGMASGGLWLYEQDDSGQLVRTGVYSTGFDGFSQPVLSDWDGDGVMDLIVGQMSGDLIFIQQGTCKVADPCSGFGLCKSHTCHCSEGHELIDCSGCSAQFVSTPRSSLGHQCQACPAWGSENGTCNSKGFCWDDLAAQAASGESRTSLRLLRGNGSCSCNEHFFGDDCSQGLCPSGMEAAMDLQKKSLFCRQCLPGFGKKEEGNHACTACAPGTMSTASGICQSCEQGKYQSVGGKADCSACEAGSIPSMNGRFCKRCSRQSVASAGDSLCQTCDWFSKPDSGQTICEVDWPSLVGALAFALLTVPVLFCLFIASPGLTRHIADASWSALDERVILTMQCSHHFRSTLMKVQIWQTGVPWLDERPYFYVKRRSSTQLELFLEPNEALTKVSETSMGLLKPFFFAESLGTTFLGIPLLAWMCISILGMMVVALFVRLPWWFFLAATILDAALVAALRAHRWKRDASTPLQRQLQEFQALLPKKPTKCSPGPERAISLAKLQQMYERFRPLIRGRNMYYICPNIVLPITKKVHKSFAEVVGCGLVDWFISHFWGLPFADFILSLQEHAISRGSDLRYWVCTFSNNQWDMEAEVPSGKPPSHSSFYKALTSPSCCGTGMMMDTDVTPLRRSWCLFEMLHTFLQEEPWMIETFEHLFMIKGIRAIRVPAFTWQA